MASFRQQLSYVARDSGASAAVDDDGLRLPAGQRGVVDVLFDGRRVWSVAAEGGAAREPRMPLRVRWPGPLRRFLGGPTRVTLRDHGSGDVLLDREHRFGTGTRRINVADAEGRPLVVDKVGHLEHPFEAADSAALGSLLDRLGEVLRVLHDEGGVPAFVAYGALLGGVREGRLIGHDSDIDLSYLSRHAHPLDVARESYHLQRVVRRHGFEIRRFSAADFKVRFPIADGTTRGVDIFGAFVCEGVLHAMPRLRVPLRRSDIVPLGEIELEGRAFPAPADPERFLAAAYGEHWRVPDPSWRPEPEPSTRRWFDGWTRGLRSHRDHWERSFGRAAGRAPHRPPPVEPSTFARWVADHESPPRHVVDVGAGDGRDALWLARAGHRVTGLDYAYAAVGRGREAARRGSLPVSFEFLNLYELRQVLAAGARLAHSDEPVVLCGRHVVDAVEEGGRENFWRLARMALRPGGRLYLEFRTGARRHVPGPGGRFVRPLQPDLVVREIESHGGAIEQREPVRVDAAPGKSGPDGCRLIARW
ncbi:MAG: class I SAM-dependent methyltransferase [Streptosporangiaceae bacterium]